MRLSIAGLAMRAICFGACAQEAVPAYPAGDAHPAPLDSAPFGHQLDGDEHGQQQHKSGKEQKRQEFVGRRKYEQIHDCGAPPSVEFSCGAGAGSASFAAGIPAISCCTGGSAISAFSSSTAESGAGV